MKFNVQVIKIGKWLNPSRDDGMGVTLTDSDLAYFNKIADNWYKYPIHVTDTFYSTMNGEWYTEQIVLCNDNRASIKRFKMYFSPSLNENSMSIFNNIVIDFENKKISYVED